MRKRLSRVLWVAAYSTEEASQEHATAGRRWHHAGCRVALSILRLLGGWI